MNAPIASIDVCTDCMLARESGDLMATPEARIAELWSKFPTADVSADFGASDQNGGDSEDGITDFTWAHCPACGSTLGGSRYRYAVWSWEREPVPAVVVTQSQSLPDTTFYRAMTVGHFARKGHVLDARLESTDGELWSVARTCC